MKAEHLGVILVVVVGREVEVKRDLGPVESVFSSDGALGELGSVALLGGVVRRREVWLEIVATVVLFEFAIARCDFNVHLSVEINVRYNLLPLCEMLGEILAFFGQTRRVKYFRNFAFFSVFEGFLDSLVNLGLVDYLWCLVCKMFVAF